MLLFPLIHRLLPLRLLPTGPAKNGPYHNAGIMILAAPHEYPRIQPFIEQVPAHRRILLQKTDHLLDVAAALTKADLFIGNDSGLMHMAAAVGIPTLGLFGPSPYQTYAPYGPKAAFVRTQESYADLMALHKNNPSAPLMASITVEMVLAAVNELREKIDAAG
jgi:heptosyltransferase-3